MCVCVKIRFHAAISESSRHPHASLFLGEGGRGQSGYCPKILLAERAKIVLCFWSIPFPDLLFLVCFFVKCKENPPKARISIPKRTPRNPWERSENAQKASNSLQTKKARKSKNFPRSHREIWTRNRPLSEMKFLYDFWGPLPLPASLLYWFYYPAKIPAQFTGELPNNSLL